MHTKDQNLLDLSFVLMLLLSHIRARFSDKLIEPLPGKDWETCLQIIPSMGCVFLHYHVEGDKSSRGCGLMFLDGVWEVVSE